MLETVFLLSISILFPAAGYAYLRWVYRSVPPVQVWVVLFAVCGLFFAGLTVARLGYVLPLLTVSMASVFGTSWVIKRHTRSGRGRW